MVDLDPGFFIDRAEDAVPPPGPQAPQIRRPVRERLRRPPLIGKLADSVPERTPAMLHRAGGWREPFRGTAPLRRLASRLAPQAHRDVLGLPGAVHQKSGAGQDHGRALLRLPAGEARVRPVR